MWCFDIEVQILLLSNIAIVSLIFGIILESVFMVQVDIANLPIVIVTFYSFFLIEHIILLIAALRVRFF